MKSETINYWEQVKKNPTESYKEFFEKEKEFLQNNVPKDFIVLDIGCGTGESMKILSPITKKIIGIDNDEDAIKKCDKNLKGMNNIEVILGDAEKMQFKENSFDVVICMGTTFCNFGKTKLTVLKEIKRVLKSGGYFIVSVYNEFALDERLKIYKKYWRGFFNKGEGTIIYKNIISEQFTEDEITSVLKKIDFKILNIVKGEIFYLIKAQK